MANEPRRAPSSSVDRGKTAREWLDVLAKAAIAAAGVFVAILANNYQQKASVVTLLSQRETAESDLRSSMMDHLVGPFVGSVQEKKPLDPDEERVLLEILALNFHAHFELKPLFLKVDGDLRQHRRDAGRTALQAVARRVVDRQIGMLQAAGLSDSRSFLGQLFSAPPAAASQADLFFERTQRLTEPDTVLQVSADRNAAGDDVNTPTRPARFGGGGGQAVCSTSPDGRFALRVRVTSYDSALRMAAVSWDSSRDVNACARGQGAAWQPGRSFSLSPYDFPLTDNTQLDPKDRFALNLYYITDDDPQSTTLQLKLVWFPEGYITERERPMNAYEVKRTLGLQ